MKLVSDNPHRYGPGHCIVPFPGCLGVGWGFLLQRPSQRVRGRGDNDLGMDGHSGERSGHGRWGLALRLSLSRPPCVMRAELCLLPGRDPQVPRPHLQEPLLIQDSLHQCRSWESSLWNTGLGSPTLQPQAGNLHRLSREVTRASCIVSLATGRE